MKKIRQGKIEPRVLVPHILRSYDEMSAGRYRIAAQVKNKLIFLLEIAGTKEFCLIQWLSSRPLFEDFQINRDGTVSEWVFEENHFRIKQVIGRSR